MTSDRGPTRALAPSLLPLLAVLGLLAAGAADAPVRAQQAGPATGGGEEAATALVIHGGAGSMREVNMSDREQERHMAKLREALRAGHRVLEEGGSSVDACVAAIQVMERSPLFNAGVGAVLTSERTVEHDASIMDGATRNSGAVAGVGHLRSPIAAARLVMDSSEHVMLAGEGAETFAEGHGFELVPNGTFYTGERREQWERSREGEGGPRAAGPAEAGSADIAPGAAGAADGRGPDAGHLGTVGCAALDREGDLAAGTSTGGTSNKRFGRIGDSPIIGAGTYADNGTAAVSATGHGEDFIRGVVAHDIAAMMRYAGLELEAAVAAVIHGRLEQLGPQATGGVIALDGTGQVAVSFNTPGMYRAWIDTDGRTTVRVFRH